MAVVKRVRRLANPGMKKGSKEAREFMAKLRGMRRANAGSRIAKKHVVRKRAVKRPNVGELVTISLGNPAKRRVSKLKKRGSGIMAKKTIRRKRRNPVVVANPRRQTRASYRRRNPVRRVRRYARRRNPSQVQNTMEQVGGVIGGATLTGIIAGIMPPNLTQGLMGYAVLGIVAYAQGMVGGKVFKSNSIGESMQVGGFTVLVLKALGEFLPGLSVGLAPRGLGWLYANAPMTVAPMGRPFLAYNQPSGLIPSNMAAGPQGAGLNGFSRGRVGFGR